MANGDGQRTLAYAVRPRVVLKYLGELLLTLAVLNSVPALVCVLFDEVRYAPAWLGVAASCAAVGLPLARMTAPRNMQWNEALLVTALFFLIAPMVALPPWLMTGVPLLDAFFEAVSGVTTTGLSTITHIEDLPRSFLFARAWTQWYGGIGFAVLAIALLTGHDAASRRLVDVYPGEELVSTTRLHARRILIVYLTMTVVAWVLLWIVSGDAFIGLLHTLSAVSTGGFSNFDASLAGVPGAAFPLAVSAVCLAGAVALPAYYLAWSTGIARLVRDVEVRALLLFTAVLTTFLAYRFSMQGLHWDAALLHGFSFAASAQSTTGFSTLPVGTLDGVSKLAIIGSMFVGASVGSTGGGIKLLRLLVFLRVLQASLLRLGMPPHAVAETRLGGRLLGSAEIVRTLSLILLFIGTVFVSWLAFVWAGYDPLDSLFEVVSATCTVGLSTGITAAELSPWLKSVLCLDMWLGRVEVLAGLVLFARGTWFGERVR